MNEWQVLERRKHLLTKQQYRTIKGQLRAGDAAGAMRGLIKLTGGGEPRSQPERSPVQRRNRQPEESPAKKANMNSGAPRAGASCSLPGRATAAPTKTSQKK
nr:MAG TPA: hypothetical protein [Caudoviricetes sp.]